MYHKYEGKLMEAAQDHSPGRSRDDAFVQQCIPQAVDDDDNVFTDKDWLIYLTHTKEAQKTGLLVFV